MLDFFSILITYKMKYFKAFFFNFDNMAYTVIVIITRLFFLMQAKLSKKRNFKML